MLYHSKLRAKVSIGRRYLSSPNTSQFYSGVVHQSLTICFIQTSQPSSTALTGLLISFNLHCHNFCTQATWMDSPFLAVSFSHSQAFPAGMITSQCLETGAIWKRSMILMLASVVEGANLTPANSLKKVATNIRISNMARLIAMQPLAPDENGWNLSWTRALLCDGECQRL